MRIGVDFDNTIVCYDKAIMVLSKDLIDLPKEMPLTKLGLRDYMRATGRQKEWTTFQGELYGPGMFYAQPFEGAIKTLRHLSRKGHELFIISHRTIRPHQGPPHDLHQYAKSWIEKHLKSRGLFCGENAHVNFLDTREKKLNKISDIGCDVFIDDLPEVLCDPAFPADTMRVLFDPLLSHSPDENSYHIREWEQMVELLKH